MPDLAHAALPLGSALVLYDAKPGSAVLSSASSRDASRLLLCDPQADWNIVKKGWYAHVLGEAPHTFSSAAEAVKTLRVRNNGHIWTTAN